MPAARAASLSPVSLRPEMPMIGVAPIGAGKRTNAPRRFEAVDAGQRYVHQHDVVAARHGGDRLLAGADEIGAMAELGEDGVEDDAAVRVVLDAENS